MPAASLFQAGVLVQLKPSVSRPAGRQVLRRVGRRPVPGPPPLPSAVAEAVPHVLPNPVAYRQVVVPRGVPGSLRPPRPHALRAAAMGNDDVVDASLGHRPLDMGLDPLAVAEPLLSPAERVVLDEQPAEKFFELPRIGVANADAGFEQQLVALYRRILGPLYDPSTGGTGGSVLLDLCSGWSSHLPPELKPSQVFGHGMNEEELTANRRLTSSFLRDLNRNTRLPLPSGSVSAALCCNGLQYLTRPEWVMAEVRRVLVPGGCVVVSFSDCCWAERATAGWLARSGRERLQLVARVLESAGLRVTELLMLDAAQEEEEQEGGPNRHTAGNSDEGVGAHSHVGRRLGGDPLYAVVARKPAEGGYERTQQQPRKQQAGGGGGGGVAREADPALQAADALVGAALHEMDLLLPGHGKSVSPAVLERWRLSYDALVDDAQALGIPRSAIPDLPADTTPHQIREARDHLRSMIASFLSSGL